MNNISSGNFIVIDTETNYNDEVMSIGVALADCDFHLLDCMYLIVEPEYQIGGMYSDRLAMYDKYIVVSREEAIIKIITYLEGYSVSDIFAFNARFDYCHLPELCFYNWYDIMKIAKQKKFNKFICNDCDCSKNGVLKRNYGAEAILRLISNSEYNETHNGMIDAIDELYIMKMIAVDIECYKEAKINEGLK